MGNGIPRRPSIAPPKKPPETVFHRSSFSRKFAVAVLANWYAPPTAAVPQPGCWVSHCLSSTISNSSIPVSLDQLIDRPTGGKASLSLPRL